MTSRDNRLGLDHLVDRAPGGASARRARVLAHPDLVQRLTERPLRFTDPHRWNGWIPPRSLAEEVCGSECGRHSRGACSATHQARFNDSPYRRALVEIAAEAYRRELQPALDEADGE